MRLPKAGFSPVLTNNSSQASIIAAYQRHCKPEGNGQLGNEEAVTPTRQEPEADDLRSKTEDNARIVAELRAQVEKEKAKSKLEVSKMVKENLRLIEWVGNLDLFGLMATNLTLNSSIQGNQNPSISIGRSKTKEMTVVSRV